MWRNVMMNSNDIDNEEMNDEWIMKENEWRNNMVKEIMKMKMKEIIMRKWQ